MSDAVLIEAAALLGARQFKEVIRFVDDNTQNLNDDSRVPVLLQAFYAARNAGLQTDARRFALEIAKEDPNLPTVKRFLQGS